MLAAVRQAPLLSVGQRMPGPASVTDPPDIVRRREPIRLWQTPVARRKPSRQRIHGSSHSGLPLAAQSPRRRARCRNSAPIERPASSMPWPRPRHIQRLDRHARGAQPASASRERCAGTTSSASPCTSSTGAWLRQLGRQGFRRDQRAGKRQDRARRDRAAQPGEQHRHRALAEAHQRIGVLPAAPAGAVRHR